MKKIIISLLSLAFLFIFVGCSSSISNIDENNGNIINDAATSAVSNSIHNKKELEYEPEYQMASYTLNEISQDNNTSLIEDTVSEIYDSVVTISATSSTSISSGSGVLIAKDDNLGLSYIATCFHVIEDAYELEVTLTNDNTYEALVVGGYEDKDLAILSIKNSDEELTYASIFKNSDDLRLGSTVICIGNPLGTLPGSVSTGVVSYVNRNVLTDTYRYQELIQTDVAINSGNSGGGLFNLSGALIGIVNGKYSSTGVEGLGFAIPSNDLKEAVNDILSTAKYDVANEVWNTGYVIGDYEFGFNISLGQYSTGGFMGSITTVVYVSDVSNNETKSGTNLAINDIINSVSIDYKDEAKEDITYNEFQTAQALMQYLYNAKLEIGDSITFSVTRNRSNINVTFEIEQYIYSI